MNVVVGWLALCTALFLFGPQVARSDAAADLKRLEQSRYDALIAGDMHAFGALMTEQFFYNHAEGGTTTKPDFVAYMKTGEIKVTRAVLEDTHVRIHGDVAVVSGKLHTEILYQGAPGAQHTMYLHVWVKRGDTWALDAAQHTHLPAAGGAK